MFVFIAFRSVSVCLTLSLLPLTPRSVFDGPIWVVCICCIWFDVYVPSFFQLVLVLSSLFLSLFLSNHSIFFLCFFHYLNGRTTQDKMGRDRDRKPLDLNLDPLSPPLLHLITLIAQQPSLLVPLCSSLFEKKKPHCTGKHAQQQDGWRSFFSFFCISQQTQITTITPWLQFATVFILCSLRCTVEVSKAGKQAGKTQKQCPKFMQKKQRTQARYAEIKRTQLVYLSQTTAASTTTPKKTSSRFFFGMCCCWCVFSFVLQLNIIEKRKKNKNKDAENAKTRQSVRAFSLPSLTPRTNLTNRPHFTLSQTRLLLFCLALSLLSPSLFFSPLLSGG